MSQDLFPKFKRNICFGSAKRSIGFRLAVSPSVDSANAERCSLPGYEHFAAKEAAREKDRRHKLVERDSLPRQALVNSCRLPSGARFAVVDRRRNVTPLLHTEERERRVTRVEQV